MTQGKRIYPRSAIIDGRIALIRECVKCGKTGECGVDFRLDRIKATGYHSYHSRCNECRWAGQKVYDHTWRARKNATDPQWFADAARINKRLRAERDGEPMTLGPVNARSRFPLAPFQNWLRAYQVATGLYQADLLGADLGIHERVVRHYLTADNKFVQLNFVDRALMNSRQVVELDGRPIYQLEDLYPEELVIHAASVGKARPRGRRAA